MVDRELIRFYFDTMALNDHLMQWYRALFIALEAIFFAGAFALHQANLDRWIAIPIFLGLVGNFLWVWVATQRGRIVDRQKTKINEELEKGDKALAIAFKIYSPEFKWEKYLPRNIFNFALPLAVGFLLIGFQLIFTFELFGTICWICCAVTAAIFLALSIVARVEWSWRGVPDRPKMEGRSKGAKPLQK